MVRIGIVGIGSMGTNYLNWFKEGKIKDAAVTAVCDISPERITWARENLPNVTVFEDYKWFN